MRPKVVEIVNICSRLQSEIQIHPQSENTTTKQNNLMEGPQKKILKKATRQMALTNVHLDSQYFECFIYFIVVDIIVFDRFFCCIWRKTKMLHFLVYDEI